MPIQFSTEAANADRMMPESEPRPAPRPHSTPQSRPQPDKAEPGTPGKDINAAGFIKDRDGAQP